MTIPNQETKISSQKQPYFYKLETSSLEALNDRAEKFLSAFAAILRYSNYRFLVELYARTSAKCGRCAVSCQVYQTSDEARDVPCYRTNLLLDVYKQYFSNNGNGLNGRVITHALSNQKIDVMAEVFYRCTACRRCSLDCPLGIDHGLIAHLGRYALSEAGIAPRGLVVSVREQLEGKTSNTSAIPLPALLNNIEFLQEEIQEITGQHVDFPVDQQGADYIAPSNMIEERLAEIWADVLHIEQKIIGIDDDFFKLGGHSLKAAVMITQIHKSLNVKLLMHEIFDMPTIRKLATVIADASEEEFISIELAEDKEYYLQTSAQKRLYFIEQLEEDSVLYNIQLMDVYCKGIDKAGLEMAFKNLIERHESLRTSFFEIDGVAVQKIHDYEDIKGNFEVEYYETGEDGMIFSHQEGKEWTRVTGISFQEVVEHFVRPFNLAKPPLIRVGLIKIWGNTRILMLDMHHIISDGVSNVTLIKDLWDLYDQEELPELRVHYRDFSEWVNKKEQLDKVKNQEAFWLKEFEGEIPVLGLPCDYRRPSKMTFEGDMIHFEIDNENTRLLNIMAQKKGNTLYMILFTFYNILLSKLSGQDDIVVGTVTAGRGHADLQPIVGMFVDTLAMRNYPASDKNFFDLLEEIKNRTLAAFENQNYPFEELVSKVATRQDKSRNPLFDVVFTLDNEAERSDEYLLDVLLLDKSNPYGIKRSKFDLMLMGAETGEGLQFNLEYNTQLFKEDTVERFTRYFKQLVASVCRNSNQKLSEIDILPEDEKCIILYAFNNTVSSYPWHKSIHELFEEQVQKTPESTAVVFYDPEKDERSSIDYIDLNRKVNRMANLLREKGTDTNSIVGMMAKKSIEMIVGVLATLKTGGAYLPLNPDYPVERKEYIVNDWSTAHFTWL